MASMFASSPPDPTPRPEYVRGSRHSMVLRLLTLILLAAVIFLGTKMHANFAMIGPISAPETRLFTGQGTMQGTLVMGPEGTPSLQFLDRGGRPRLLASLGPDGAPSLVFLEARDPDGLDWTPEQYGHVSLFLLEQVGPTRVLPNRELSRLRVFTGEETAKPRLTLGVADSNGLGRLSPDGKEPLWWSTPVPR